jgi:hypothetical protein
MTRGERRGRRGRAEPLAEAAYAKGWL